MFIAVTSVVEWHLVTSKQKTVWSENCTITIIRSARCSVE